jgi:hypothetical protein
LQPAFGDCLELDSLSPAAGSDRPAAPCPAVSGPR